MKWRMKYIEIYSGTTLPIGHFHYIYTNSSKTNVSVVDVEFLLTFPQLL